MKIRVSLIVLLALVAVALLVSGSGRIAGAAAQAVMPAVDNEPAVATDNQTVLATASASESAQGSGAEPASGQSGSSAGESQTPAGSESPPPDTGELEEFVPSERVPADSAISFPVDI
jgi:hypothetical protein